MKPSTGIAAKIEEAVAVQVDASLRNLRIERQETFSGPLPHPDQAEQYEKLLPGFMDRTLGLAEKAQKFDEALYLRRDRYAFWRSVASLFSVVAVLGAFGGGAFYLLLHDHRIEGFSALAAVFVPVMVAVWKNRDK